MIAKAAKVFLVLLLTALAYWWCFFICVKMVSGTWSLGDSGPPYEGSPIYYSETPWIESIFRHAFSPMVMMLRAASDTKIQAGTGIQYESHGYGTRGLWVLFEETPGIAFGAVLITGVASYLLFRAFSAPNAGHKNDRCLKKQ